MEHDGKNLTVTKVVRSVQLLKIDGYCATATLKSTEFIKPRSRWHIDGHKWEVHFYPDHCHFFDEDDEDTLGPPFDDFDEFVALKLILVSEPQRDKLRVNLCCLVLCPGQPPSKEKSVSHVFHRGSKCSPELLLMLIQKVPSYLMNDSLTVQCTITVLGDLDLADEDLPLPPSDLHRHLDLLLQSQEGADVKFHVSGESFAAHKVILAARSPVFMAKFFGGMEETSSDSVEIKDMEAAVFRSMLHFIYTDIVPELNGDQEPEAGVTMAQHLLAAAERYGLDRLKKICECKLSRSIGVDTVATTLALAEQHHCKLLKAKCVEFITKSRVKLLMLSWQPMAMLIWWQAAPWR